MDLDDELDAEDQQALRKEATLLQETDNSPRPEDGEQPPQDQEPKLIPEGKTQQDNHDPEADVTAEGDTKQPEQGSETD
jgi:hypothetical protein